MFPGYAQTYHEQTEQAPAKKHSDKALDDTVNLSIRSNEKQNIFDFLRTHGPEKPFKVDVSGVLSENDLIYDPGDQLPSSTSLNQSTPLEANDGSQHDLKHLENL